MPPVVAAVALALTVSAAVATVIIVIAAVAIAALYMVATMDVGGYDTPGAAVESAQHMIKSPKAPVRGIYGEVMTSGPIIFAEESSYVENKNETERVCTNKRGTQQCKEVLVQRVGGKTWLNMVIPVAGHAINDIIEVYFGDELQSDWDTDFINITVVDGNQTTIGQLPANLTNLASWTDTMIGFDKAFLYVRLRYHKDLFPNGLPNIKCKVLGKVPETPFSTGYTNNAAAVIYDYLITHLRVSPAMVNSAAFANEYAISNEPMPAEQMPLLDFTGKPVLNAGVPVLRAIPIRYEINGGFNYDESHERVLAKMLAACAGKLMFVNGQYYLQVGAYRGPTPFGQEVNLSDVIGSMKISPDTPLSDRVNTITATYTDRDSMFQTVDMPIMTNPVFVAEDSGEELAADLQLEYVLTQGQAQRLAHIALKQNRLGVMIEVDMNMRAFKLNVGLPVIVNDPSLGYDTLEFTVEKWDFDPEQGGVKLSLRQTSADIYDDSITTPKSRPEATTLPDHNAVAPITNLTITELPDDNVFDVFLAWSHQYHYMMDYYEVTYITEGGDLNTVITSDLRLKLDNLIGSTYTINVVAVRKGMRSDAVTVIDTLGAPKPLFGVTLIADNFEVTIKPVVFGELPNNTTFKFYRGTVGDTTPTYAESEFIGEGKTYTDSGLLHNTEYNYYVQVSNGSATLLPEGPYSVFTLANPDGIIDIIKDAIPGFTWIVYASDAAGADISLVRNVAIHNFEGRALNKPAKVPVTLVPNEYTYYRIAGFENTVEPPVIPTGVIMSASESVVMASWDQPSFSGYWFTQAYRALWDGVSALPVFASAVKVKECIGVLADAGVIHNQNYVYWFTHLNVDAVESAPTAAKTIKTLTPLDLRDGWVTNTLLESSLSARIDLIDTDAILGSAGGLIGFIGDVNSSVNLAASAAETAATNASTAQGNAETALTSALTAAGNSATSASAALVSKNAAATSATSADGSKTAAATSATAAVVAQTAADGSASAALVSKNAANTSAVAADGSKTAAATSATAAATSKTGADGSASAALTAKTDAETAATSAVGSKNAAATSATAAVVAQTAADGSASAALTSSTSATASKNAAATSATAAATAQTAADGSASAALASKTAANTSAVAADGSKTAAATSATAAALSKTGADGSASAALTAKTDAETASTSATGSKNAAATSAAAALVSQTAADGSASSALTSKTSATTSASNAAGSATTATSKAAEAVISAQTATDKATLAQQVSLRLYNLDNSTNKLKTEDWIIGTTGNQPAKSDAYLWTAQGTVTTENFIINTQGPYGSTVAWEAVNADAALAMEGGFQKTFVALETQALRFVVWVQRNPVGTLTGNARFYFGLSQTTTDNLGTTTQNTNPYFCTFTDTNLASYGVKAGDWICLVGYAVPNGTAAPVYADSGVYSADGRKLATVTNFNIRAGATTQISRVFFYDATVIGDTTLFAEPRVEVVDGTETAFAKLFVSLAAVQSRMTATENEAFYSLKVQANGKVAGFGLTATPSGTAILFNADQIGFTNGTTDVMPFSIRDGIVWMSDVRVASIQAISITNVGDNSDPLKRAHLGNTFIDGNFILGKTGQIQWKDLSAEFRDRLVQTDPNAITTGGSRALSKNPVAAGTYYLAQTGGTAANGDALIGSGGASTQITLTIIGGIGWGADFTGTVLAPKCTVSLNRKKTGGTTEVIQSKVYTGTATNVAPNGEPAEHVSDIYVNEVVNCPLPVGGNTYEYWFVVSSVSGSWAASGTNTIVAGGTISCSVTEVLGSSGGVLVEALAYNGISYFTSNTGGVGLGASVRNGNLYVNNFASLIANNSGQLFDSGSRVYSDVNKPTLATLGYTGAANANYITNTTQITNGSGFITAAANVASATVLQTARTIGISGAVTGTATSFNGSANITIAATSVNAVNLSGVVPNASISGAYTGLTNLTGSGTVDFAKFLGSGADTVALPSFSWTGDDNTGIYSPAADQLAITTGGVQRLLANSSGITAATFIGALSGNATSATTAASATTATTAAALATARTIGISGAVTGTAISFNGSANITIAATSVNAVNLSGVVPNASISGAYSGMTDLTGSGSVDFAKFLGTATDTAATPSFTWTGDLTTGIYRPAASAVAVATAGAWRATFDASGIDTLRVRTTGTGNDYHTGAIEVRGNGATNTVFPTIGFHQAGAYAASLQLRAGTDFRFYAQGAAAYANVTALSFIGALSGNATSATLAASATVLQTARTIAITGAVTGTATSFNGGANIAIAATSVNAVNLSGVVPNASISGTYTGLTSLTGSGTVDFAKFLGAAADTAALPSFSWTTDANTGIYNPAADQLGITTGGVQRLLASSTGIAVTGVITATGNITATGEIYANGAYYYGDAKAVIQFSDAWLRINPLNQFTAGIYCNTGILRTDGQFEVGGNGASFKVTSTGDVTAAGVMRAKATNNVNSRVLTYDDFLPINPPAGLENTITANWIGAGAINARHLQVNSIVNNAGSYTSFKVAPDATRPIALSKTDSLGNEIEPIFYVDTLGNGFFAGKLSKDTVDIESIQDEARRQINPYYLGTVTGGTQSDTTVTTMASLATFALPAISAIGGKVNLGWALSASSGYFDTGSNLNHLAPVWKIEIFRGTTTGVLISNVTHTGTAWNVVDTEPGFPSYWNGGSSLAISGTFSDSGASTSQVYTMRVTRISGTPTTISRRRMDGSSPAFSPIKMKYEYTSLYYSATGLQSGSITLADDYDKFEFLATAGSDDTDDWMDVKLIPTYMIVADLAAFDFADLMLFTGGGGSYWRVRLTGKRTLTLVNENSMIRRIWGVNMVEKV
jgi:hypothetical protein